MPLLPLLRGRLTSFRKLCTHASGVHVEGGAPGTPEHRVFLCASGHGSAADVRLSFWHDVFLRAPKSPSAGSDPLFHFVAEIPKGTRAKMEVNLQEGHNPIAQDVKDGELRYFRYGDLPFNYGCLPQTWENPDLVSKDTGASGDGDPLDVVEIGPSPILCGRVVDVKVLGVLGMIDGGETDWKVVAVGRHNTELFPLLHDIGDVDRHLPGKLDAIRDWFRYYKTAEGKSENHFAFNGRFQDKEYALRVIEETHEEWKRLVFDPKHPARSRYWIPK